jgi:hypothetical protein
LKERKVESDRLQSLAYNGIDLFMADSEKDVDTTTKVMKLTHDPCYADILEQPQESESMDAISTEQLSAVAL